MDVRHKRYGGSLVFWSPTTLDGNNSGEFRAGVQEVLTPLDMGLVIDMQDLAYISRTALRIVLTLGRELEAAGQRLALCSLQENVRKVFEISGFDQIISIYDTPALALEAVS